MQGEGGSGVRMCVNSIPAPFLCVGTHTYTFFMFWFVV